METKQCTKCKVEKPLVEFGKHKTTKDKLQNNCKTCIAKTTKDWILNNPKKHLQSVKNWQLNNPEQHTQNMKNWQINNLEQHKLTIKKWILNNPKKHKQSHNKGVKNWVNKKQGVYEWYEGEICLYVGQSSQLNQRISHHKSLFKNPESSPKSTQYLYKSLQHHPNASIRVIEECSHNILLEREQHYIDALRPLYNIK